MADADPWVDSDEPEVTEEVKEEVVEEEVKEEPVEEKKPEWKPKGLPEDERWEPIELTPEAQKRFNRIYAQNQSYKRTAEETAKIAKNLSERIAELESKATVYDEDRQASKIDRLTKERREALASGDDDRVLELTDEIIALKQEKRAGPKKKEEVKEPEVKEELSNNEDVDPEVAKVIFDWRHEQKNGRFVRPWAVDGHKENKMATKMAEAIVEEEDGNITIEDLLARVDAGMNKYLGITKERKPTNVEGGGGPNKAPTNSSLTPEQKRVAKMMFPNDKDPYGRYSKALSTSDVAEDF